MTDLVTVLILVLAVSTKTTMPKKIVTVKINSQCVEAEVDTGSPIVLIGSNTYEQQFSKIKLQTSSNKFRDASGRQMNIIGTFIGRIKGNNNSGEVKVYVHDLNRRYALLGGEALDILLPNWQDDLNINLVSNDSFLSSIKSKFSEIVDGDFSKPIKGVTVDLKLKEGAVPVVGKSRPIPFAIRDRVKAHLDELIAKKF